MPRRPEAASAKPARYTFRALDEEDLSLVACWLAEPHVREWWGENTDSDLAEIRAAMESIETEPLIVELDGRPIAYLQTYDPHLEDDHPYQDQPFGTLGVDLTIGPTDFVGRGHGSALLKQFAAELFGEGVPRLVIDPDPGNTRAIRAYEKAGFQAFDRRTTVYGDALMMALDNPEAIKPLGDAG